MVIALPLPDEFIRGHYGRLRQLHKFRTTQRCASLRFLSGSEVKGENRQLPHQLVASAIGMDTSTYLRRHSLIPFLQLAAPDEWSTGDFETPGAKKGTATSLARTNAYFCLDCIQSDRETQHFSYWRREHQLPGVDVCDKHRQPLMWIGDARAFEYPPEASQFSAQPVSSDLASLYSLPIIVRYLSVAKRFLTGGQRVWRHSAAVHHRMHAAHHGLRVGLRGNRPNLSSFVARNFPNLWLEEHFPSLLNIGSDKSCATIDAACRSAQHTAGMAHAMILAATSDCSTTTLDEFFSPVSQNFRESLRHVQRENRSSQQRKKRVQNENRKRTRIATDRHTLLAPYLEHRGVYSEIAKAFGVSVAAVSKRFRRVELLSLAQKPPQMQDEILVRLKNELARETHCAIVHDGIHSSLHHSPPADPTP
ncbi:TniQ family protein [Paraburkholderia fungorum]|uniref:TniQ family protein n=1 Tax=Paraburkholderia fungorum TaxID=134537 RepID=UPI001C1F070E|nr:TniQ family protein [Paraburkholderia fungorum]MBU7440256.1 TniQ family protein [Paraburkholderia fungorum]